MSILAILETQKHRHFRSELHDHSKSFQNIAPAAFPGAAAPASRDGIA
jgi:hypothetical protein